MIVPPFGRVFIGPTGAEVQFTADPETLEVPLPKRYSTHPGLGGIVTIQDFGLLMKDATVRLEGEFLDDEVVRSLLTLYQTRGKSYHYLDWEGNDFTVFITDFAPVPYPWKIRSPTGAEVGGASRYRMTLQVMTATQLWGQSPPPTGG